MFTQEKLFTIHHLLLIVMCIRFSLSSPLQVNEDPETSGRTKRCIKSYYGNIGVSDCTCKPPDYPRDCQEVYDRLDGPPDGVYVIKPDGYPKPFEAYCDNTFDSGGWTVFQRRVDGGADFFRDWEDYKDGFGFLYRNYWLGNEKLAYITNQRKYELRIDLTSPSGSSQYGRYDLFRIADEGTMYKLQALGTYEGNIGSVVGYDYMNTQRNQYFSTYDRDYDGTTSRNCGQVMHGGWWYNNCYYANLNGVYGVQDQTGICLWDDVHGLQCGISFTEMKIRPI